ncbi:MAG: dihydrofolate reductase family protein, partial [Natronomonas sp.]
MYVHVNAAVSVDGKLSSRRREQIRISESADFARVDRLRARTDAILVGVGTVLADDPSLTRYDEQVRRERNPTGVAPPARIVVDSRCRTPTDAEILSGYPKTIVLTSRAAPTDRRVALENAGATVLVHGGERVDLVDG